MRNLIDDLSDEIAFWNHMLKINQGKEFSPEYQRMKDALELAKYKLSVELETSLDQKTH